MKDIKGNFRTMSLFYETNMPSRGNTSEDGSAFISFFTLKPHDHSVGGHVYLSLKAIYFDYDHIPGLEYEFAMDVFSSWDHWVRLTDDSAVRKHFADWRRELEVKIRADALKSILVTSKNKSSPSASQAARFLVEKGWIEKKAGRPSKEEVERERKIAAGIKDTLSEDMARLGLSVV